MLQSRKRKQERLPFVGTLIVTGITFGVLALLTYLYAFMQQIFQGNEAIFPAAGYGIIPMPSFIKSFAVWLAMLYGSIVSFTIGGLQNILPLHQFLLLRKVVLIPLLEEITWRGPLRIFLFFSRSWFVYIPLAFLFTLGFMLSHQTGLANLILIFVNGASFAVLVKVTGRLWPAVLIHAILNIKA